MRKLCKYVYFDREVFTRLLCREL